MSTRDNVDRRPDPDRAGRTTFAHTRADGSFWKVYPIDMNDEPRNYRIVRMYKDHPTLNQRVIARGLTLAEAQAHCSDPETSSSTATSAAARARTRRLGPWFDGYEEAR